MNLAVRERHEVVALEEIEDALAKKIHDDADMSSEVEAVSEMNAAISVLLIVGLEGCQDTEFDLAGISVLLYRTDDLDGNELVAFLISGLHDFAECTLAEKLDHLIYPRN